MKLFDKLSATLLVLIVFSVPAFASVMVTSPYNGSTVSSPFTLSATATACSSQSIVSMGYSLDNSSSTAIFSGSAINASVSAASGGHTVHVKSWGNAGAVCVIDVSVTVSTSTSSTGPSVSSPLNGASVTSPFTVAASSSSCGGQPVSVIGYSIDSSTSTSTVSGTVLNTSASTASGGHTVHVKSWGNAGAACDTDVAVSVTATSSAIPSTATTISNIQNLGYWSSLHDSGTPGTSSGWTGTTSSPSRSGNARQFATSFTYYGGQRYTFQFSDNTSFHNFVYDAWVYIQNTTNGVANIEMDLNQVIGNGMTVIMGFQCDGWSNTWDYTANTGSATSPVDQWIHSGAACSPKKWAVNTWHHVQIAYARTDDGHVNYQSVTLDGASQNIGAWAFSGFSLGWAPTILTNFQIDGDTSGSGSSNVFLDELTLSEW